MKPLAVSIYYIIFSENGNNENDKKFDRFDPMSYFNDLSFSYVGAQEVYFPMTRTQVQPSWFWSLEYCRRGHFVFAKNSENPAEIATHREIIIFTVPGTRAAAAMRGRTVPGRVRSA